MSAARKVVLFEGKDWAGSAIVGRRLGEALEVEMVLACTSLLEAEVALGSVQAVIQNVPPVLIGKPDEHPLIRARRDFVAKVRERKLPLITFYSVLSGLPEPDPFAADSVLSLVFPVSLTGYRQMLTAMRGAL